MLNSAKKNDKFISTFFQIQVSDGEHFLSATMAPTLRKATRNGEIVKNTLIKVLDFEKQAINGHVTLRLNKVSIVSQDPGQRFGNPSFYYDVFHDKDEDDGQPIVSSDTPIETQICQELMQRQDRVSKDFHSQTLVELYSCMYPLKDKPVDSKILSSGWQIDSHGTSPGPRCRWIPAQPSKKDPKSPHGSLSCLQQS